WCAQSLFAMSDFFVDSLIDLVLLLEAELWTNFIAQGDELLTCARKFAVVGVQVDTHAQPLVGLRIELAASQCSTQVAHSVKRLMQGETLAVVFPRHHIVPFFEGGIAFLVEHASFF